MKTIDLVNLINEQGFETSLGDALKKVQGTKIHKCPECNGEGFKVVDISSFNSIEFFNGTKEIPTVLFKNGKAHVECSLCKGHGFTEKQYKPKMVQQGWEEAL